MSKPLGLKILAWISIIGGISEVIALFKKVGKPIPQLFFDATISILWVIFGIGLLKLKKFNSFSPREMGGSKG